MQIQQGAMTRRALDFFSISLSLFHVFLQEMVLFLVRSALTCFVLLGFFRVKLSPCYQIGTLNIKETKCTEALH